MSEHSDTVLSDAMRVCFTQAEALTAAERTIAAMLPVVQAAYAWHMSLQVYLQTDSAIDWYPALKVATDELSAAVRAWHGKTLDGAAEEGREQ